MSAPARAPAHAWHIRKPNPERIELWQNLPVAVDRTEPFMQTIRL
jgi:hypothetical protein